MHTPKIQCVAILLMAVISHSSFAQTVKKDGYAAMASGDFDQALEIFDQLGEQGDSVAEGIADYVRSLTPKQREQAIAEMGAEALKEGDFDRSERMFSLARENAVSRGDADSVRVFGEVLGVVAKARAETADRQASTQQESFQVQDSEPSCQTTVTIEIVVDEGLGRENCSDGAPEALITKHRQEVAVAWQRLVDAGPANGSILVLTKEQTSRSIVTYQQDENP